MAEKLLIFEINMSNNIFNDIYNDISICEIFIWEKSSLKNNNYV